MKVVMTAQELMDMNIWANFCHIRGWNVYVVNEGLVDADEEICLSKEEVEKLGITVSISGGGEV